MLDIIEAIDAQHTSQSTAIRQDRESMLNSQFQRPEFFAIVSEIFSDATVGVSTV